MILPSPHIELNLILTLHTTSICLHVSLGRTGFDPTLVRIAFVVKEVVMEQFIFRVQRFSPLSVMPAMQHSNFFFICSLRYINVAMDSVVK
jgi:hypothetical protein